MRNELKLKIIIDVKAKKVVFAEAGKDFVDFMFGMLSLPLATVVKLLNDNEEGMAGSVRSLCKSVESLKAEYFEKNVNKNTVLKPKFPLTLPFLSLNDGPVAIELFKCQSHRNVSDRQGVFCPYYYPFQDRHCNRPLDEVLSFLYVKPKVEVTGYVKESIAYIVADNLDVQPMSFTVMKSLVSDLDFLEEKQVKFGPKEGIALLRASLETNDVLTTVFLGTKMKTRRQ